MKKLHILIIVLMIFNISGLTAQDTISKNKALNIPLRRYGISIGNSRQFNGIRLNFADKNVKRINGLNLTLWTKYKSVYTKDEIVNGISVGVLTNAKKMQPLNFFILGSAGDVSLNGLSVAGIGVASEHITGICVTGVMLQGEIVNGVSLSGLFAYSGKAFNGLTISGLAVLSNGEINGFATGIAGIYSKGTISGISITPGYLQAKTTMGITFAGFANINQVHGLSIALFNIARELHGLQLGILNYAGNNRKGLKALPLINMHFRKTGNQ